MLHHLLLIFLLQCQYATMTLNGTNLIYHRLHILEKSLGSDNLLC